MTVISVTAMGQPRRAVHLITATLQSRGDTRADHIIVTCVWHIIVIQHITQYILSCENLNYL